MPGNGCAVPGCTNRSNKPGSEGLSFYSFPYDNTHLLRQWLIKMHLSPNSINKHSRICSVHFIGGKRKGKDDIPQIFLWNKTARGSPKARQPLPQRVSKKHYVSVIERRKTIAHDHCYCQPNSTYAFTEEVSCGSALLSAPDAHIGEVKLLCDVSVNTHQGVTITSQQPIVCSTSCQTDINFISPFSIDQIANDKKRVRFYTGFDDYDTLMICYRFLGPCVHHLQYWSKEIDQQKVALETRGAPRLLSPLNEFFLVLCRLRLGLLEQDLAFHFGISQPTVSRICITWINAMYFKFREVSIWPTREEVNATMPASFKDYPTTRIVIDATEIFIEPVQWLNSRRSALTKITIH